MTVTNGGKYVKDRSRDDRLWDRWLDRLDENPEYNFSADARRTLTLRQSRRLAWQRKVRRGW